MTLAAEDRFLHDHAFFHHRMGFIFVRTVSAAIDGIFLWIAVFPLMHDGIPVVADGTADIEGLQGLGRLFIAIIDKGVDVLDDLLGHAVFRFLQVAADGTWRRSSDA